MAARLRRPRRGRRAGVRGASQLPRGDSSPPSPGSRGAHVVGIAEQRQAATPARRLSAQAPSQAQRFGVREDLTSGSPVKIRTARYPPAIAESLIAI